ncbi:hypothetical protein V8G54_005096 [Vigna mungo]|uniref:Uncharacterized protein n=1 Tax=Vigna mungo TaxID=3915 RepID=A0AAQ3SDQ1_VIGMU
MEPHDLHRHLSPPLFSDPEPLPEFLTRSTSDSSAVTVEDMSKDFSSHSAPAPLLGLILEVFSVARAGTCLREYLKSETSGGREVIVLSLTVDADTLKSTLFFNLLLAATGVLLDQSTRWTDQQHSLYIRSLETSFVNELHRSMRLRIWSIKNSTDEACQYRILRNSHNMPKQTLALQDACQKRINLERISPLFESTADSHILTGSQFEFASVDRGCSLGEPINCKHGLLCDQEIHARGSSTLELACSTTEVTDQNFKDEEAKSSCMPLVKRLKKAAADGSSRDQVEWNLYSLSDKGPK